MKNKKKGITVLKGLSILFFIIGFSIILFPYITNFFYNNQVKKDKEDFIIKISQYANMVDKQDEYTENNESNNKIKMQELHEELKEISQYENIAEEQNKYKENNESNNKVKVQELYEELKKRNEELYENNQSNLIDPFSYQQQAINLDEYGLKGNTIGFVYIPRMKIELPILLGANEQNMQKGAVHLTETSYPIGGINSNSVIVAHRGWGRLPMFKNIQKLKIGDDIYIQNFKEQLKYEVVDTKVINPTDISQLYIQEGRDLITLVTCHPYGVNTHRYIVFCERQ